MVTSDPSVKYLVIAGTVHTLYRSPVDFLWRDSYGTVWALRDESASVDSADRCGIGWLALPLSHQLTASCATHDYLYESPAYQLFHTREEADAHLRRLAKLLAKQLKRPWYKPVAQLFYTISQWLGGRYWENKTTR